MPFDTYWSMCILDTVTKANSKIHTTINDISRKLWERYRHMFILCKTKTLNLNHYRMFGEYGHIPKLQANKKKLDHRALVVRYLYSPNDRHYKVMNPTNGYLMVLWAVNFKPYNPTYDPRLLYNHVLPLEYQCHPRINAHHIIPWHAHAVALRLDRHISEQ